MGRHCEGSGMNKGVAFGVGIALGLGVGIAIAAAMHLANQKKGDDEN